MQEIQDKYHKVLSCEEIAFADPIEITRRLAIPYKKEERSINLSQDFDREIELPTSNGKLKYSLVATVQHLGSTGLLILHSVY